MDTKMTFAELDNLIDYCAIDLHDYENVFHDQLKKLNSVFWEVEHNNMQFPMIENRLAILNSIHIKIEMELLNASVFTESIEQILIKLEDHYITFEGKDFLDIQRQIYGLFEQTDINLNYYKNEVDLIMREIKNIEKDNSKNPLEHIAKIMSALLNTLDFIEMKIEQMKNRMHWIDQEIRSIFCEIYHKN